MMIRLIILSILAATMSGSAVQAASTRLALAADGEVLAWLVLGPLPNTGQPHTNCEGFEKDWLGGEAAASPAEGATIEADGRTFTWRLGMADSPLALDLRRVLGIWGESPAVAYIYTAVQSDAARQAQVLLGSDDGMKLWVNGELVHTWHGARGVKRDEDKVGIRLQRGMNRLLFKVDQGSGGWGLAARLVGVDGEPLSGLTQVLDVSRTAESNQPGERAIHASANLEGVLDVRAAMDYDQAAEESGRWLKNLRDRATEPDRLQAALEEADKAIGQATGADAGALSKALRAGADSIQSAWKGARQPFFDSMQSPPPLFVTDVGKEDYLQPAPGGRFFVDSEGKPYLPVGYNHNPDWPEMSPSNPQWDNYNPQRTHAYFAELKANGVNLVRLMLETPTSGAMEDPIGTFVPEHIVWVDNVFAAARKHGIRLMVIPWDTFWMNQRWDICLYNADLGGPVKEKIEWLTDPKVKELQKKRLKLMVDRWGNLGEVFCWELMNEIDLWWGASPDQIIEWTEEMAAYIRTYEKQKWGRNHMIAVSTAASMPRGKLAEFEYRSPVLDMATTHLYIGASMGPSEPVEPAANIAEGVRHALGQIQDGRPYFDSENGPINRWISDQALDDAVFHNMIWAHLAAGGCGSGLRWPYRHPHHLSDGMLDHLRRFADFVDEIPWAKITGPYGNGPSVESDAGTLALSSGADGAGIVWLLARDGEPGTLEATVTWPGGPETVRFRAYDTRQGKWIASGTLGNGRLRLQDAPDSVAVILEGSEP